MSQIETPSNSTRNIRLESFLKKYLSPQIFDDVRYYEGCVVRVSKDSLVYKFVILTSTDLLLADQACRTLQLSVQLANVSSIAVEHDLPEFLEGPLQCKCQHLQVVHEKRVSASERETPPASLVVGPTPSRRWTSQSTLTLPHDPGPPNPGPGTPGPDPGHLGQRHTVRSISSLMQRVRLAKPRIPRSMSSLDNHQPSGRLTASQQLLPRVDLFNEALTRDRRSYSSLETTSHILTKSYNAVTPRSDSPLSPQSPQSPKSPSVIDIYVVNTRSSLLHHLYSHWCSRLIVRTLERSGSSVMSGEDRNMSTALPLEAMCSQLKRALSADHHSVNSLAALLQDVKRSLHASAPMRRLFWKEQSVFPLLVENLRLLLHKPRQLGDSSRLHKQLPLRVAQLQAAVLLLDTLAVTLGTTDNCTEKSQTVKLNHYGEVRKLLHAIVVPPGLSQYVNITCSRMLEDFSEYNSYAWMNLPEAELITSSAEIATAATAVLYELLMTLDNSPRRTNNTPILANLLEGVRLDYHIKRSMTQLLALICSSATLLPAEAVWLYKQLCVMRYLMEHRAQVREYIRQHCHEELRYFICWHRISRKIPEEYPVKQLLPSLLTQVHQLANTNQQH